MRTKLTAQQGVISIEFALAFPAFILMVLLWAEISYLGFVSSVVDMASSAAVRKAKSTDIDLADEATYGAIITDVIGQTDSLWTNIIDPSKFSLSSCYFNDVAGAAINDLAGCNADPSNNPVALFQIGYQYNPIYSVFGNLINLDRELIVILEFERS